MARPYEDDLRCKVLEAHDRGAGTLRELAKVFGVSLPWVWKISAARKRTGQSERVPHAPGRKRKVDEAVILPMLVDRRRLPILAIFGGPRRSIPGYIVRNEASYTVSCAFAAHRR